MPNFDASRPHSLNYGAIGAIVGHEISHGFDDTGRNYDEAGNLRNWWSNATLKEYKSRASCIEKQYSSLVEPMTGMHVRLSFGSTFLEVLTFMFPLGQRQIRAG